VDKAENVNANLNFTHPLIGYFNDPASCYFFGSVVAMHAQIYSQKYNTFFEGNCAITA